MPENPANDILPFIRISPMEGTKQERSYMSLSLKRFAGRVMLLTTVSMAAAVAQDRPGIDRPIRVGQFRGTGTGGSYWHDNIHQSSVLLNTILTNPSTSNLGDSLIVPTHNPPFIYTSFGV